MTQSTILAAGTTAATSTDITLSTGAEANVALFTATTGQIPDAAKLELRIDTAGADTTFAILGDELPAVHIRGPGVFRVYRPAQAVAIGVSLET